MPTDADDQAHVEIHTDRVTFAKKNSALFKVGAAQERMFRPADVLRLGLSAATSVQKREDLRKYRHDPDSRFRAERQRGEGAAGAAHK